MFRREPAGPLVTLPPSMPKLSTNTCRPPLGMILFTRLPPIRLLSVRLSPVGAAILAVTCGILPEATPWCKDGMILALGDSCRELTATGEARLRVRSDGHLCVHNQPSAARGGFEDPGSQDAYELCTADWREAATSAAIAAGLGVEATSDSTWTIRK